VICASVSQHAATNGFSASSQLDRWYGKRKRVMALSRRMIPNIKQDDATQPYLPFAAVA